MINLLREGDNIGQLTHDLETEVSNSLRSLNKCLDEVLQSANLFLQGGKSGFEWGGLVGFVLKTTSYDDLVVQYKPLFEQIFAISREKGFRDNILSYNEHRRIGSTVPSKYAIEPDVPIGILALKWDVQDERQSKLTVEEARIARELEGRTTLDESGKVTDRVNPDVKDSYHFLTPQRKAEIIELEPNIVRELGGITREAYRRHEEAYGELLTKVKEYMVGKLSTPEMTAVHDRAGFGQLIERAWLMSFHYGFRDYMLTSQEIMMSGRRVERKYRVKPYVPIGIQSGLFSIEDIRKVREQEKTFPSYTRAFSKWRMPFRLSLEPLTDNGETMRGPTICDEETHQPLEKGSKLVEFCIENYVSKGQAKAHFARPQDWYFRQAS